MKNLLFFFIVLGSVTSFAQQAKQSHTLPARIENGDTIAVKEMELFNVYGEKYFMSAAEKARFDRLVRYVKKVYPYAKIAEQKYLGYVKMLSNVSSEKEKRKLMRQAEEDIKAEFYDDIKNMTFTQGRILLKLIYRQTQFTSYKLLQDYRGEVRAMFWQGVARIFGANLKSTYDPNGEDREIEQIIQMIERGEL